MLAIAEEDPSFFIAQVKGMGDSLAGGAETFELHPLRQGEITKRASPEDVVSLKLSEHAMSNFSALEPHVAVTGGYPTVQPWFESNASRLSDHHARELRGGGYADHFQSLPSILTAGTQQEIVRSQIARDLGVSENTVDAYLRTATRIRLLTTTKPWGCNLRGRVARRPKTSLNDTGFAAMLSGCTESQALSLGGDAHFGALVEQFVATELEKQRGWSDHSFRIYHYRDTDPSWLII